MSYGLPTCDGCFFWYPSTTNNSVEIFSIPTCPKNLEIFDLLILLPAKSATFFVVKFMESWDSMVKVTYHLSDTICASEGTAAQQPAETAGWVTQTSISKWRPWTWPRTAAIAWGPS